MDFGISFKGLLSRSSSGSKSSQGDQPKDHNSNRHDNTKAAAGLDTPYLKIDTILDQEENDYHESRRSTATLGNNSRQSQTSLLPPSPNRSGSAQPHTPSPYLSICTSPNLRRSSTSDIIKTEPGSTTTTPPPSVQQIAQAESRRPSTSSLLRKARERKDVGGGAGQVGRSISQLATPTAGRAARSAAMGQRRKSMAAF